MATCRVRDHAPELLAIASVPIVLAAMYLLRPPVRARYVLEYTQPTLLTAYTAHFVHLEAAHLLTNLTVYLLVVPVAYLLAARAGRLPLFRAAFVTYLFVLPVVLSGLNLMFARPRVGYGFSGINMAFLGLLTLLVIAAAGRQPKRARSVDRAPGLFFAGTGLIATLAVPSTRLRLGLAAAATLSAMLYFNELPGGASLREGLAALARSDGAELTVTGLAVFVFVPFAAFPPSPADAGTVLNLYTHLLGYSLGFIAPYATVTLLEWDRSWGPVGLGVSRPVQRDRGSR